MKKNIILSAVFLSLAIPMMASAQTVGAGFSNLQAIVQKIAAIVNMLIPLVFSLGILGFFWGLVKYIFAQSSEDGKKDAKNIMLWSLVALFIMASVFGIITLAQNTVGVNPAGTGDVRIPKATVN